MHCLPFRALCPKMLIQSSKLNNLRATLQCIGNAGLKLTMHQCHFGATEIDILRRTITAAGVRPQRPSVQNFLKKTTFPKSKKAVQRYSGFLNNFLQLYSEKITQFYNYLKNDKKVLITQDLLQKFAEVNEALG